jgi:triosephosphate isomerase
MRTALVAGNWKMNGSSSLIGEMVPSLNEFAKKHPSVDVLICPPSVFTKEMASAASGIKVGAQNVFFESSGAFTGEVSVEMLKSVGCEYVIIGHSERRALFSETDEVVSKKVLSACESGLISILCVGETLEERESGNHFSVIRTQLIGGVSRLSTEHWDKLVIAYEPVWAIGTGKTASPEQAQEVHAFIRRVVSEHVGQQVSDTVKVLYGGSVNAANAKELFAQNDIDGGLVGGASLKKDEFLTICAAAVSK